MQTFLPYSNFTKTAKCLDYKRLGKQRVEAKQIINLLEKYDKGEDISKFSWGNHPAVRMWIGCTFALKIYYNEICKEWIERGYEHNMGIYDIPDRKTYRIPDWLGRKDFHDAHKSNLLRKNSIYYEKFGWKVSKNLKYKWK